MSKHKKPSLSDFARQTSNQTVVTINLVVVAFLIIVLFVNFATDGFGSSGGRIFSIFLTIFSVLGILVSTSLIIRNRKMSAISKGNNSVEWTISLPELQKSKINKEVVEIAEFMQIPEDQYSDLLLAYIVAEDLSLRQIQQEAKQPLIRHARIGETEFDAILLTENLITCIEVTFLVSPEISEEKIKIIEKKIYAAKRIADKQFPNSRLKLMLVVVTQLDAMNEAKLRSNLTKEKFAKIPVNYFEIGFYSFEELQNIYTV